MKYYHGTNEEILRQYCSDNGISFNKLFGNFFGDENKESGEKG